MPPPSLRLFHLNVFGVRKQDPIRRCSTLRLRSSRRSRRCRCNKHLSTGIFRLNSWHNYQPW
jgi:hypothetical protein